MGECIEWQGSLTYDGYGIKWVTKGKVRAHRWVWERTNGPIPEGAVVMHVCDNRKCVNVAHLRLGTPRDNVQDCISKGRFVHNTMTRSLTSKQVKEIREKYSTGRYSFMALSREYLISDYAIRSAVDRRTYAEVE